MNKYLLQILDFSEVWAMLIPLVALYFRRSQPKYLKPVIAYLWIGLVINIAIDTIMAFWPHFPPWAQSNNFLYNLHSLVRFICFSIFFIGLPDQSFLKFKQILPVFSIVIFILNFTFLENFFDENYLGGNFLTAEAYLLLIYCMLYYLTELRKDDLELFHEPYFWIVTGLSIYLVINFFVFLFYIPMTKFDEELSINMWNVHNVAFIFFCCFIAKAFYVSPGYQYSV